MSVIKSSFYLIKYKYNYIQSDALAEFRGSLKKYHNKTQVESTLKLFEVYCHITKNEIDANVLHSKQFEEIADGFIKCLTTEFLISTRPGTRRLNAECFKYAVDKLKLKFNCPSYRQIDFNISNVAKRNPVDVYVQPSDREYWCGFLVISRKGRKTFLDFSDLWMDYDRSFTMRVYHAYRDHIASQATSASGMFNTLASYLCRFKTEWPISTFDDPVALRMFFNAFAKFHFIEYNAKELSINVAIRIWSKFVHTIDRVFIQSGIWVEPVGGLPRPKTHALTGEESRIKTVAKGKKVKETLLTEIPLEVTDQEAFEIIKTTINQDINNVVEWADINAMCIYNRCMRRLKCAADYNPNESSDLFASIAFQFEKYGFDPHINYKKLYKVKSKKELATSLGLPVSNSLFPYQVLLVHEHPQISRSFLEDLEIYNKHGQLSGFLKTDSGAQLIGYKDRRGPQNAEQKITLTDYTITLVEQIILITAPLRSFLQTRGDDNWRFLFLTCGRAFSYPVKAKTPGFHSSRIDTNKPYKNKILAEFHVLTGLSDQKLEGYINRISLSRLRASCGVRVFLKTKSVEKMAKALGHKTYKPALLSHYLPYQLVKFFQERDVRSFQKSMICQSFEGSPNMLEVSRFSTIRELDDFLKNHGFKDIPEFLTTPESVEKSNLGHILIDVGVKVLAILASLRAAVKVADETKVINEESKYWSKLAKLVFREIEKGYDQKLIDNLKAARVISDSMQFGDIIYDLS